MDFGGVVGVDKLVGASSEAAGVFSSSMASPDTGLSRQIVAEAEDHDMRCLKVARTEPKAKVAPFFSPRSRSLFSDGEQMLSFSSTSTQDAMMLTLDGTLPYYHHPSASTSTPSYLNAGLYSGSFDMNTHGVLARVRGPFTPSQWLELERQALIYKYIVANVAIPPSLLIPTRKSLSRSGFPTLSAESFGPSTLGWGNYNQGYSGNDDPEPGRCRRTDGKKWRCSRDAVADQKYCERHMNRGRHRSRKHVEGRTGHAAKAIPAIAPSPSASALSGDGISGNLTTSQHQTESLQTNITDCCSEPSDRLKMGKGNVNECTQDTEGLSMLGSLNSRSISNLFPVSKAHNPFEETSSGVEPGLISMDSPLEPHSSSFSDNISYVTNPKLDDQQTQPHHLRHFMDEWPQNQFHSHISWSEVEQMQSDRTQLSISIPMACSDFVSSSSPNHDNLISSPFKSSQEYDTIDRGLGVSVLSEANYCQTGWIPISWESSMAGPLGEVLNNTSSATNDQCRNFMSSSINFLADGCGLSTWLESSPTGVLQRTSFCSVSSSTGSSPRAENHKSHESNGSLCDDILGSVLVNLPTIPS